MDGESRSTPLFFDVCGNTPDGLRVALDLEAWQHRDDQIWWVIEDVFRPLGVLGDGEYLCAWWRKRKELVNAACASVALELFDVWRPNRKSLKAAAKALGMPYAPGAIEHDEWHMSTCGMIVVLMFLATYVHGRLARLKTVLCPQLLFEALLTNEDAEALLGQDVPQAIRLDCGFVRGERLCCHLEDALQHRQATAASVQRRAALFLQSLWVHRSTCGACMAWFKDRLQHVVSALDRHAPSCAYTSDPRKRKVHGGDELSRKRRRLGGDYKQALVTQTVTKGWQTKIICVCEG